MWLKLENGNHNNIKETQCFASQKTKKMTIQELIDYIEENNFSKNMEIIVNGGFVQTYAKCTHSELHEKIGDYLTIESDYSEKRALESSIKERFIRRQMHKGLSRNEAKELFMDKYIRPYAIPFFGELSVDAVFNYEKDLPCRDLKSENNKDKQAQ